MSAATILPAAEWADLLGRPDITLTERASPARAATLLFAYCHGVSREPVPCCGCGCAAAIDGREKGGARLGGFYLPTDAAGIPTTRGGIICAACMPQAAGEAFADPARLLDLDRIADAVRRDAGRAPAGLDLDAPEGSA